MTKVKPASPGEAEYTLPPSVLSASGRLMEGYDDLLSRSEAFSRMVADEVRQDPDAVADLIQQLASAAKVVFQRWTLPILYVLSLDPTHELRFSQIRSYVHGISGRSLSLQLDGMERNGLLERKVTTDRPPHVSYRLTSRGQMLSSLSFPMVLHLNMVGGLKEQLRPKKR
ncbi:MAG: winged helix-turn-helix transcriptional regulator [Thermoplasmatota archaeon]